jgi:hypothetical protein
MRDAFEIARHASFFLLWVVENFDVRWLSSRCQSGDGQRVGDAFRYVLAARASADWRFLESVPATPYGSRKIDAIDVTSLPATTPRSRRPG